MKQLFVPVVAMCLMAMATTGQAYQMEIEAAASGDQFKSGTNTQPLNDVYSLTARLYTADIDAGDRPYRLAPFLDRASFVQVSETMTDLNRDDRHRHEQRLVTEYQLGTSPLRVGLGYSQRSEDEFNQSQYELSAGWYLLENARLSLFFTRQDEVEQNLDIKSIQRGIGYTQIFSPAGQHVELFATYTESEQRSNFKFPFIPIRFGDDSRSRKLGVRYYPMQQLGLGVRHEAIRNSSIPFFVKTREELRVTYIEASWDVSESFGLEVFYGTGDSSFEQINPGGFLPLDSGLSAYYDRGITLTGRF